MAHLSLGNNPLWCLILLTCVTAAMLTSFFTFMNSTPHCSLWSDDEEAWIDGSCENNSLDDWHRQGSKDFNNSLLQKYCNMKSIRVDAAIRCFCVSLITTITWKLIFSNIWWVEYYNVMCICVSHEYDVNLDAL